MHEEVRERIVGYLAAAFGLVAGLAWNDAISAFIQYFFPLGREGVWAKFVYAGVLTTVVVIVSMYLARMIQHQDTEE